MPLSCAPCPMYTRSLQWMHVMSKTFFYILFFFLRLSVTRNVEIHFFFDRKLQWLTRDCVITATHSIVMCSKTIPHSNIKKSNLCEWTRVWSTHLHNSAQFLLHTSESSSKTKKVHTLECKLKTTSDPSGLNIQCETLLSRLMLAWVWKGQCQGVKTWCTRTRDTCMVRGEQLCINYSLRAEATESRLHAWEPQISLLFS